MTKNEFIDQIKKHGLVKLLNENYTDKLSGKLSVPIIAGCHLMINNLDPQATTLMKIHPDLIIGQVGRFNECRSNCCSSGYKDGATWKSLLNKSTFDGHLDELQKHPECYFEMSKPLKFYTENNKFFSTGCSRRAIVAKNLFSLYQQMTGYDQLINIACATKEII